VLYPVLLAVCGWTAARRRSAREFLPVLALVAGQVLELVLFATLRRPLPLTGVLHTTFSSGHSAAAVLGWGLVAWQLDRALRSRPRTKVVWATALAAGAVVGATRVYLGVHWLSDAVAGVIAGALLLATGLAALAYVDGRTPARQLTVPVWLRASQHGLGFCYRPENGGAFRLRPGQLSQQIAAAATELAERKSPKRAAG